MPGFPSRNPAPPQVGFNYSAPAAPQVGFNYAGPLRHMSLDQLLQYAAANSKPPAPLQVDGSTMAPAQAEPGLNLGEGPSQFGKAIGTWLGRYLDNVVAVPPPAGGYLASVGPEGLGTLASVNSSGFNMFGLKS